MRRGAFFLTSFLVFFRFFSDFFFRFCSCYGSEKLCWQQEQKQKNLKTNQKTTKIKSEKKIRQSLEIVLTWVPMEAIGYCNPISFLQAGLWSGS